MLTEVDRYEATVDPGLRVQLRPIFGQDAVSRPLVAANRVPHRRDAPRQPLLQLPGEQNSTAAAQDDCQRWRRRRRRGMLSCSPAPAAPLPAGLPPDFDPRAYVENHPEIAAYVRSPHDAAQHYLQHGAAQHLLCTRLRVIMRLTGVAPGMCSCMLGVSVYDCPRILWDDVSLLQHWCCCMRPRLPAAPALPLAGLVRSDLVFTPRCSFGRPFQPAVWVRSMSLQPVARSGPVAAASIHVAAVAAARILLQLQHGLYSPRSEQHAGRPDCAPGRYISALMLAAATGAEVVLPPAFVRRSFGEKEPGHHTWRPLPLGELLDVEQIISSWQRRGVIVHRVRGATAPSKG